MLQTLLSDARNPAGTSLPAFVAATLFAMTPALAIEFGMPAACALGVDCFVQSFADMDASSAATDPFCGAATYDGHDGLDLRILSFADIPDGVPVIAPADGRVLRLRDGVPDRLVRTDADKQAVAGKECGNGLLIEHAGGIQTQLYHMRQGSIAVAEGAQVRKGDTLGEIGASGMVEFAHVHVTVRKDGVAVDPMTGRALAEGCIEDAGAAEPLFAPDVAQALGAGETQLLATGLAGAVIDHAALSLKGPPPSADTASAATVGWAWFINLHKGDRVRVRVAGPDGVLVDNTSEPLERTKADYSAYAGKRGAPKPGDYVVDAALIRDGAALIERRVVVTVD
jgi:murein DD-endopeptidase MepM/ murein hydrolase activator NlpD